jgi:molybdopterin molybdotransferase
LRPPGGRLERGQIHDSNSLLLAAAVAECGGIPVQLGSVPDDEEALRSVFERHAPEVDAFVTSGGVSVGAHDVVKAVLAPLGVWFGAVRMQPGRPQGFGQWRDGTPIFALPGNQVGVFVSFEEFVRPALLKLQGRRRLLRPPERASVAEGWRSPAERTQFMPVVAERHPDGTVTVRPASGGGSGSYLVASLAGANALAVVPESVTEVRAGEFVDVTPIS